MHYHGGLYLSTLSDIGGSDTKLIAPNSLATSISFSEHGYVLVGFQDGTIALYNTEYSSPLSVWYDACDSAVKVLKWCSIYFSETKQTKTAHKQSSLQQGQSHLACRLIEFFVVDESHKFYIWNLSKSVHKPHHIINFADKH